MRRLVTIVPLLACCVAGARAADQAATAPDPAQMQAAMEQMSKTGAEHEALKQCVGEWDVVNTFWMAPGAPSMQSKGHVSAKEILGGKWIREDFHGDMMGQPFEGVSLEGYDTAAKKFRSVWLDSATTMMTDMSGTSSDGDKTITYTSEMEHCPMTNGPVHQRWVVAFESADKRTLTCYDTPQGVPEYKSMEIVYTRVAAAK